MIAIICFTTLLLTFTSITFSQSVMDYQTGTGIVVEPGADICADEVIINGTYTGGGTIIEGFYNSSSHTMVSDTVIIFLRNAVSPFEKVDSAKSVLDISGAGTFIFFNISNGTNYYIVITHRNSIETWSSFAISFSSGTLTYDFSSAANQAYGDNLIIKGTRWCIYSGDVNQDGIIDASDISAIENDVGTSGYVPTDLTGDDFVDASDISIVENNSGVLVRNPIVGESVLRNKTNGSN